MPPTPRPGRRPDPRTARGAGDRDPDHVDITPLELDDPVLTESPTMVQDDEEEVFDLGFIVEDRDDRRDTLLASWQRLDELDSDEPLESDPAGPLPKGAKRMEEEGVPPSEYPTDARIGSAKAEADEADFAKGNTLIADP
jgi:hypothetical protein